MSSERNDPARPDEPEPRLDIDAAFAEIVANWTPDVPEARTERQDDEQKYQAADEAAEEGAEEGDPASSDPDSLRRLFRPAFSDTLDTEASWDDEGHFVPPPPPPLPVLDPRRKIAWCALLGSPALALLLIVLGAAAPPWLLVGMVAAFVGGFLYLVATMGSSTGDGWNGGDGAVL